MKSKLKDCPFCGGEAHYEQTICDNSVRCLACSARTMVDNDAPVDSVQLWNMRPGSEEVGMDEWFEQVRVANICNLS